VINTLLQPHIKNLNNRNYKIKINNFLTNKITELTSDIYKEKQTPKKRIKTKVIS